MKKHSIALILVITLLSSVSVAGDSSRDPGPVQAIFTYFCKKGMDKMAARLTPDEVGVLLISLGISSLDDTDGIDGVIEKLCSSKATDENLKQQNDLPLTSCSYGVGTLLLMAGAVAETKLPNPSPRAAKAINACLRK